MMAKNNFNRYIPDAEAIKKHKSLQCFGALLLDQNLWGLNRRSVSMAFLVGLFWAMIAIPFQMFFAAGTAILFRANIPVSVGLVWITNPITMPPIFYFSYVFGTWLLPNQEPIQDFELSLDWITQNMPLIWQPLYLGGAVLGITFGILAYVIVRGLWRWKIIRKYNLRKQRS